MPNTPDYIYRKLNEWVLTGRLSPGDRISERELAMSFHTSRVPVRESLQKTQYDGIITLSPQGAFVRTFNLTEIEQLYELRELLEGLAARRAARVLVRGALDGTINALRNAAATENLSFDDAENLGVSFHQKVFEICGNPFIQDAATKIQRQTQVAKHTSYRLSLSPNPLDAVIEHLTIALAINNQDVGTAEREMQSHIRKWADIFRRASDQS